MLVSIVACQYHTTQPAPKTAAVHVTFSCGDVNLSGIEFLFARQALASMEAVERNTRAGAYRVDP